MELMTPEGSGWIIRPELIKFADTFQTSCSQGALGAQSEMFPPTMSFWEKIEGPFLYTVPSVIIICC